MANLNNSTHNSDWIFSLNNFKIIQSSEFVRFYDCNKMQYLDLTTQQRIKKDELLTCIVYKDKFIKTKDGDYFIINNSLKKGIYMELFNFLRNEIIKYPSSEFIKIILTLPNWQNYS